MLIWNIQAKLYVNSKYTYELQLGHAEHDVKNKT